MTSKPLISGLASIAAMAAVLWSTPTFAQQVTGGANSQATAEFFKVTLTPTAEPNLAAVDFTATGGGPLLTQDYGFNPGSSGCVHGCFITAGLPGTPNVQLYSVLNVRFTPSVSSVSALAAFTGSGTAEMVAVNSLDIDIASCTGAFPLTSTPAGCFKQVGTGLEGTLMVSAPDISQVFIAGVDVPATISNLLFSGGAAVPEPKTFSLLALALAGLAIMRKRLVS